MAVGEHHLQTATPLTKMKAALFGEWVMWGLKELGGGGGGEKMGEMPNVTSVYIVPWFLGEDCAGGSWH